MSGHPAGQELAGFEGLDPGRREEVLRHVRDCADCRARWAAEDPSRLFATLALAPCDPGALDRLTAAVGRGIELATARRSRARLRAAASIAAALLLAALVGSFLWNGEVARPEAPGVAVETAWTPHEEWSGVELVDSPGEAQVVDLTIGETRVVMIFDEALDL